MKCAAIAGATLMLIAQTGPSEAAPIRWEVNLFNPNVMLYGPVQTMTATGSFVYDADLGQFSAINITAKSSHSVSGVAFFDATYTVLETSTILARNSPKQFTFADRTGGDMTGAHIIEFNLPVPMTNAGGTIGGDDYSGDPSAYLRYCISAACNTFSSTVVALVDTDSTLVGEPYIAPVPLPASVLLLSGAFGGMVLLRRRKRRSA